MFVPCFVAAVRKPGQLEYRSAAIRTSLKVTINRVLLRPQDTLYVELSLPTVRPKLVVVSDHGRRAIDYGPVCKGNDPVILRLHVMYQLFFARSYESQDCDCKEYFGGDTHGK